MARKAPKGLASDTEWAEEVARRDVRCTFPHDGRNAPCWGPLAAHHVIRRGHKATRLDPDNGTLLCARGHEYVHTHPDWAREIGLIARPGDRVVRGRAFPV